MLKFEKKSVAKRLIEHSPSLNEVFSFNPHFGALNLALQKRGAGFARVCTTPSLSFVGLIWMVFIALSCTVSQSLIAHMQYTVNLEILKWFYWRENLSFCSVYIYIFIYIYVYIHITRWCTVNTMSNFLLYLMNDSYMILFVVAVIKITVTVDHIICFFPMLCCRNLSLRLSPRTTLLENVQRNVLFLLYIKYLWCI